MTTGSQSAQKPGIGEITRFLEEMREGDPKAAEQLLSHVYRELRALAAYERTLTSFDSPFDRFMAGDKDAIEKEWRSFASER